MTLQEFTEQWRQKACFARPDAYTAAIYASTEIHEALDAANRRRKWATCAPEPTARRTDWNVS